MAIDMNRTTIALPGSLGLPHEDAGDYLIIGPASAGDRKAIAAKAAELFGIRREIEELSAVKAALEDELKLAMAERGAEEMTAGAHRLSWKVVTSTRIDTAALKRTLPEIAARFTKESRACRFTIN